MCCYNIVHCLIFVYTNLHIINLKKIGYNFITHSNKQQIMQNTTDLIHISHWTKYTENFKFSCQICLIENGLNYSNTQSCFEDIKVCK